MPPAPWTLDASKLKQYPHFDRNLTIAEAEALANDPKQVAAHKFYPFMLFSQSWTRYADNGEQGEKKIRPLRYAARADAYIFARYRHELAHFYELELAKCGLAESVLAYRKIRSPSGGGMCNIHFAQMAFEEVIAQGDCCVIALDISSFFESLDHARLKHVWCRLLGVSKLPVDHFAVFKAMTRYSVVEKQAVYARLGFFGPKRTLRNGKVVDGYLLPKKSKVKQLCSGADFRFKIAGGNGQPNLIETNLKNFGIPQGAPISDLLANIYLLDFDNEISDLIKPINGRYFRYSDDILIVAPIAPADALALESDIRKRIRAHGPKLVIKSRKSYILRFQKQAAHQSFSVVFDGQSVPECVKRATDELNAKGIPLASKAGQDTLTRAAKNARKTLNGMEYLGFRFDGKKVYLRDSTLSNLWRRITRSARRRVHACIARNRGCSAAVIKSRFDYDDLTTRFGRVEDFEQYADDHNNWTFWTYAQRSSKIFGGLGSPILRQLKDHRRKIQLMVHAEIDDIL
jgi:hypothetical protein